MIVIRYLGAAIAALALAQAAQAQQTDVPFGGARTGELARLCGATARDVPAGAAVAFCKGFFLATGQYHQEMTAEGGAQRPLFCLPSPSPTFDHVRGAFVAWVQSNPQYAADRAVDGLLRFTAETYPCPGLPTATQGRR